MEDISDRDGNQSNAFCSNCGEAVSQDVEYCSSCGTRLAENQDNQKRGVIPSALNRTEILLSVGSAIVILGAFLNWVENPLTAATGLTTGFGYITVLFSSVILIIAYAQARTQTRMAISVVLGLLLLFISLWVFGITVAEEGIRTGGGLILTFIGTCIILVFGFREYSTIASRRRATGLVLSVFIIVIVVPVLLLQGITLWEEYQVQQEQQESREQAEQDLQEAEQDLQDIEIEEVIAYTSNYEEKRRSLVSDTYLEGSVNIKMILHNPTDRVITVRLLEGHEGFHNWRNNQEISVSAKETKTIETGASGVSVHNLSVDGRPCQGGQGESTAGSVEYDYGGESESTISSSEYAYNCNATPGEYKLVLTWDHPGRPN